jgi:hypothetical protein
MFAESPPFYFPRLETLRFRHQPKKMFFGTQISVSRRLLASDTCADAYRSFFVVLSLSETAGDLGHCV